MRFKRSGKLLAVIILTFTIACITDSEIRQKVDEVGGEIIIEPNQFNLNGVANNPGFRCGEKRQEHDRRGIHITFQGNCQEYCWVQTMREEIDGETIDSYSDALSQGAEQVERDVAERQDNTKTAAGTTVDTDQDTNNPCWLHLSNTPDFKDFPITGSGDFEGFERLSITYFETCVKCTKPAPGTDWLGCVTWAYLKVKGNEVIGPDQRRLISLGNASTPSTEFTTAVRNWENQTH